MMFPNLKRITDEKPLDVAILRPGWQDAGSFMGLANVYESATGLRVLLSESLMEDGSRWHHLSVTYRGGPPSWDLLLIAKRAFFGHDREAVQIVPRDDDLINIANCWHLWARCED